MTNPTRTLIIIELTTGRTWAQLMLNTIESTACWNVLGTKIAAVINDRSSHDTRVTVLELASCITVTCSNVYLDIRWWKQALRWVGDSVLCTSANTDYTSSYWELILLLQQSQNSNGLILMALFLQTWAR